MANPAPVIPLPTSRAVEPLTLRRKLGGTIPPFYLQTSVSGFCGAHGLSDRVASVMPNRKSGLSKCCPPVDSRTVFGWEVLSGSRMGNSGHEHRRSQIDFIFIPRIPPHRKSGGGPLSHPYSTDQYGLGDGPVYGDYHQRRMFPHLTGDHRATPGTESAR